MPAPMSARSLRGDAAFDLEQMLEVLQVCAEAEESHGQAQRTRFAHINRLRVSATRCLREAQRIDDDPQGQAMRDQMVVAL